MNIIEINKYIMKRGDVFDYEDVAENIYIDAGTDGIISKTATIKNCNDLINRWKLEAIRRIS